MNHETTDWFPGEVKPVHVGVYETKPDDGTTFQHWDGKQWGLCAITPNCALNGIGIASAYQASKWRGLVESVGAKEQDK